MLSNVKIGGKLVVLGIPIIAIPLIVVSVVAVTRASAGLEQLNSQQLISRAQEIARTIDAMYAEEMKLALSLSENPAIQAAAAARDTAVPAPEAPASGNDRTGRRAAPRGAAADPSALAAESLAPFADIQQFGDAYLAVDLIDSRGIVFAAAAPGSLGADRSSTGYFKVAIAGRKSIGTVSVDKLSGRPVTPIAVPVRAGEKTVGVIALILRLDFLGKLVAGEKVGRTGYAAVVDSPGMFIAHADPDLVMNMNILETEGSLAQSIGNGRSGIAHYTFKNVPREAGFAPVPSTGWNVILTLPTSEYLAAARDMRLLLGAIAALALLVAVLLLLVLSRSITLPLSRGIALAQTVASGDFTRRLDVAGGDEIGALAGALNGMSTQLSEMVAVIQQNAEQLAASSVQISASAGSLSDDARNQASHIENARQSMEELTTSVERVAEHAKSQAVAAEHGTRSMGRALETVSVVSKSLEEISVLARKSVDSAVAGAEAVRAVVDGITAISQVSDRIVGIAGVISDIADQTNLLALNASIEAARAGEYGRGFAVVAAEVSKLADRSSSSTKEIDSLIRESIRSVGTGVERAKSSEQTMRQIREASEKVSQMIGGVTETMALQVETITELARELANVTNVSRSISASTEEQTVSARQMSQTLEGMNGLTLGSAGAAQQMSGSTEQLSRMALELQTLVSRFKISDGKLPGPAAQETEKRDDPAEAVEELRSLPAGGTSP